jgi:O-antigen ligase
MVGAMELLFIALILVVPLWLIALVDILKHDFKGNDKIVWILVVIFLPLIGAICYWFIGAKQKLPK